MKSGRLFSIIINILTVLFIFSIIGYFIWGRYLFLFLPEKIHNYKVLKSPISISDISFPNSLITDKNGVLQTDSRINNKMKKQLIKKVKNTLLDSNKVTFDYLNRPFSVTMEYGEYKREINGQPKIVFKTYENKNLMIFTFPGKVYWFTDSSGVETIAIDSVFCFIAYNVSCDLDGNLSYDYYSDSYIYDKKVENGYSYFEKKFRGSVFLEGNILFDHNNYDSYVETEIFGENEKEKQLSNKSFDIYGANEDDKKFLFNCLPSYSEKKCEDYLYYISPYLETTKQRKYIGSILYSGKGSINLNKKKISFKNNLYMCKFTCKGTGFQMVIIADCKIKNGKIYGKTVIYPFKITTEEKIPELLNSITEYAEDNLQVEFSETENRWIGS